MKKQIVLTASILGVIAVILGAFGAHALKGKIEAAELEIWAKGIEYQFYHVMALLFLSTLPDAKRKFVAYAYWFFALGILFFSGSLYLLATREILQISSLSYIGPITPIGGLFFILGWFTVIVAALKPDDAK
jgi:uncharacterized membrane protein YgdD (TMEM256/DUF423 family)